MPHTGFTFTVKKMCLCDKFPNPVSKLAQTRLREAGVGEL